jgi:hypothetical protein
MYQLIDENIEVILDTVNRRKDIDPYLALADMFNAGSVSDNDEYQGVYRKYWQLNAARLSDSFCKHYFRVMEDCRHADQLSIENIVEALYSVPSNSKGRKTIQFSFATKLLHTVNNTLPVYDSLLSDFYFFPQIKPSWNYSKKLAAYLRAYDFLLREHKRVLDNGLLSESIRKFRDRFALPGTYTDQKIIDTVLWRFSAYARTGAIINGKMQYR